MATGFLAAIVFWRPQDRATLGRLFRRERAAVVRRVFFRGQRRRLGGGAARGEQEQAEEGAGGGAHGGALEVSAGRFGGPGGVLSCPATVPGYL